MPAPPSTDWQEQIAPDEDERFERYAEILRDVQRRENRKGGPPGRALHRKTHLGAAAELEIHGDLPPEAAVGLAAAPRRHEAFVRFSNGLYRSNPDVVPDLRGFAVKVLDVEGPKAIPALNDATTQDFLAINIRALPFADVDDFMRFMKASVPPALSLPRLVRAFGPWRTAELLRHLMGLGPPASLATIQYHSNAPIRWGDHAAKYTLLPAPGNAAANGGGRGRLARELTQRLRAGPIEFDLALQLYRDPGSTPIEDISVEWTEAAAPFVVIGRLTIPAQDPDSSEGKALTERIDTLSFDPWHALEVHRPLGNIMRARGKAYYASTTERGAAPEP